MTEIWERWDPISELSRKYYIECVTDSIKGFRVILSDYDDENKKLELLFEESVHAYRSSDESFRMSTLHTLGERYGSEFYTGCTFFKVTNSEYIEWLSGQSFGIYELESLFHFSILAVDSVLDILAAYEPKVIKR